MKTQDCIIILLLALPAFLSAQVNTPLTRRDLRQVAASCASDVDPDTIEAITRQESGYHPFALSINRPEAEARRLGYPDKLYQLARQPQTFREAASWTEWFLGHGYTVSIGLMQVNTESAAQLGIRDPLALFNPCLNIAAGAVILESAYAGQPHNLEGLARAFAIYNSGSVSVGLRNGYAAGVIANAPPLQ